MQAERMSKLTKQLDKFLCKTPKLGKGVYIAHGAAVLGDVTLGNHSSVWYNAVLRGDINRIVVGHHSNIQDNAVLHLADLIDRDVAADFVVLALVTLLFLFLGLIGDQVRLISERSRATPLVTERERVNFGADR